MSDMTSPTLREALEACPFCGSVARVGMTDNRKEQPFAYIVGCSQCPISMDWQVTEAKAINAWNRRAIPSHEAGRRAGLEEAARYAEGYGGVIPGVTGFASIVSGNNQPCMSGDARDRLRPMQRREFDGATAWLATAIRNLAGDEG